MDFLLSLIVGLPGSTAKSLDAIVSALNEAKVKFPELADQIEAATDTLFPLIAPYLSREGVVAALQEFTVIFTPDKWGPPNPGAGALQ